MNLSIIGAVAAFDRVNGHSVMILTYLEEFHLSKSPTLPNLHNQHYFNRNATRDRHSPNEAASATSNNGPFNFCGGGEGILRPFADGAPLPKLIISPFLNRIFILLLLFLLCPSAATTFAADLTSRPRPRPNSLLLSLSPGPIS